MESPCGYSRCVRVLSLQMLSARCSSPPRMPAAWLSGRNCWPPTRRPPRPSRRAGRLRLLQTFTTAGRSVHPPRRRLPRVGDDGRARAWRRAGIAPGLRRRGVRACPTSIAGVAGRLHWTAWLCGVAALPATQGLALGPALGAARGSQWLLCRHDARRAAVARGRHFFLWPSTRRSPGLHRPVVVVGGRRRPGTTGGGARGGCRGPRRRLELEFGSLGGAVCRPNRRSSGRCYPRKRYWACSRSWRASWVLSLYATAACAGDVTSAALTLTHSASTRSSSASPGAALSRSRRPPAEAVGRGDSRELARHLPMRRPFHAAGARPASSGEHSPCTGRQTLAWLIGDGVACARCWAPRRTCWGRWPSSCSTATIFRPPPGGQGASHLPGAGVSAAALGLALLALPLRPDVRWASWGPLLRDRPPGPSCCLSGSAVAGPAQPASPVWRRRPRGFRPKQFHTLRAGGVSPLLLSSRGMTPPLAGVIPLLTCAD